MKKRFLKPVMMVMMVMVLSFSYLGFSGPEKCKRKRTVFSVC